MMIQSKSRISFYPLSILTKVSHISVTTCHIRDRYLVFILCHINSHFNKFLFKFITNMTMRGIKIKQTILKLVFECLNVFNSRLYGSLRDFKISIQFLMLIKTIINVNKKYIEYFYHYN